MAFYQFSSLIGMARRQSNALGRVICYVTILKPAATQASNIPPVDNAHRTTALYHFDQLPIDPIKIVCLQQEKWISMGKTFDILCLFCRSYELICA